MKTTYPAALVLILLGLLPEVGFVAAGQGYSSQTLFVVPWNEPTGMATTSGGLRLLVPTQVSAEFLPPIKGPQFFDVDLEGNIYVGTNAQRPPEIRKYNPEGNLLWKIQGELERDFVTPLEKRKFMEIESFCCDDEGNVYVQEPFYTPGDKIAKYRRDGRFIGFISTGLAGPLRLKRHPGGGFEFLATMNNAPSGLAYPAVFKDNTTSRDPQAWHAKDINGGVYGGNFFEEYPGGVGIATTATKRVMKQMGRAIVLKRGIPVPKETFWARTGVDLEILIPYLFTLSAQHIVASDSQGYLYLDLNLKADLLTPDQCHRIVKVDPIRRQIVAEFIRYPAEKTMDLTHRDPVVVPETGDVYEFYDLLDGLHVVKFSIAE